MAFQMRSLSVQGLRHQAIPRRPKGSQRRGCGRTRAASPRPLPYPSTTAPTPVNAEPDTRFSNVFSQVETMIIDTFNSTQPGSRLDWEEVEGCFVLRPPAYSPPEAVAVFLGGAFVGASPHIAYRLFLETLCNRNVMVVAAPYSTGFDQIRIADEAQFKFDRCLKELGVEVRDLPVYGVGHSMGALLHMIINTRYTVPRAGNALLSFNNRAAIDVIPFLSPVIEPSAKMLGPILSQMSASPLGTSVDGMAQAMKGLSPSVVRQLTPLLEQLSPMYMDVSQGRSEFTPSPEEARNLIRTYYGVSKNLLVRFTNDTIDETNELAAMMQGTSAVSRLLDLTVRTLPGGHMRPLTQNFVDLPPEVARLANSAVYGSGEVIGRMAEMANEMGVVAAEQPLRDLGKGVQSMASVFGGNVGGPVTDHVQDLADELAMWMGVTSVAGRGVRTLPPSNPEPPLLQPQLG